MFVFLLCEVNLVLWFFGHHYLCTVLGIYYILIVKDNDTDIYDQFLAAVEKEVKKKMTIPGLVRDESFFTEVLESIWSGDQHRPLTVIISMDEKTDADKVENRVVMCKQ